MKKKNPLLTFIGAMSCIVLFLYLGIILAEEGQRLNPISWALRTVLYGCITWSMVQARNHTAMIMGAFTVSSLIVAMLTGNHLYHSKIAWTWGYTETYVLFCVVLPIFGRFMSASYTLTLKLFTTALLLSWIPTIMDMWNHPESRNLLFCLFCITGCVIASLGTYKGNNFSRLNILCTDIGISMSRFMLL